MIEERSYRAINRLRKEGKLSAAWEIGVEEVQKNPNDAFLKGAFFWVCYDYLKEVVGSIKHRAETNKGNFKPNQGEVDRVNFLLDWIIWLNIPDSGFEYRSMLLVFQKNLEWFPRLVLLLFKHRESLFEQNDRLPYHGENGESSSLMLKFARKAASAWQGFPEMREISIDELVIYFKQVRDQVADTEHLIWLDYDEAKCLIKAGRMAQARDFVIPVLRRKQSESWAWGALAVTYREQEPAASILLFAQGLCQVHDEKFALQLLRGIAPLLANQGFEKEASMCVFRAIKFYHENGWTVKENLDELARMAWYDEQVDLNELKAFLQKRSHGALRYLYGATEQFVAVVMNIHKSQKGFNVYRDRSHQYKVRLGVTSPKKLPTPGSFMKLTLSIEDDSVIAAELCNAEEMGDVGYAEGRIRVTEKGFGFVDDTFVPSDLVVNDMDGQFVKLLRIMDFDKKKNKYGWKALTVELT